MSKVLPNSTRVPVAGFRAVRSADPDQIVETTLVLRRANQVSDEDVIKMASRPLADRKYVTNQQLAESHGANAEDVAKVIEFAHANGLAVVEENPAARIVKLSGTVTALQKAFSVDLRVYEDATGKRSYRGRTGEIHLPDELNEVVESVHGLDNRDQAKPHFRMAPPKVRPRLAATASAKAPKSANPQATPQSFSPAQVAAAYNFPTDATGKGQTVALIELGGGYKAADLRFF